jgi:hypothetical protein
MKINNLILILIGLFFVLSCVRQDIYGVVAMFAIGILTYWGKE